MCEFLKTTEYVKTTDYLTNEELNRVAVIIVFVGLWRNIHIRSD